MSGVLSSSCVAVSTSLYSMTDLRIRGDRAVGVEYYWNTRLLPNADADVHTVRAKRMVVVSGGAFGSPAILERSGIGAKSVLDKFAIPQKVDLEGVGHDYQGAL